MLRSLHSPDIGPISLDAFRPEDPEHFGLLISASIGPNDGEGEEHFNFTLCSPSWLAEQKLPKGFAFLHSTLVLARWNAELARRAISDLCLRSEGSTWNEVAQKLSRYGSWEFADYKA